MVRARSRPPHTAGATGAPAKNTGGATVGTVRRRPRRRWQRSIHDTGRAPGIRLSLPRRRCWFDANPVRLRTGSLTDKAPIPIPPLRSSSAGVAPGLRRQSTPVRRSTGRFLVHGCGATAEEALRGGLARLGRGWFRKPIVGKPMAFDSSAFRAALQLLQIGASRSSGRNDDGASLQSWIMRVQVPPATPIRRFS